MNFTNYEKSKGRKDSTYYLRGSHQVSDQARELDRVADKTSWCNLPLAVVENG